MHSCAQQHSLYTTSGIINSITRDERLMPGRVSLLTLINNEQKTKRWNMATYTDETRVEVLQRRTCRTKNTATKYIFRVFYPTLHRGTRTK